MMTRIQVVNRTRGTVLGGRIRLADEMLGRLRGFLFRGQPEPGEGILLSPCQAVHMIGMRYALDIVFIDEHGRVVGLHHELPPWRWTPLYRRALHALELPAGTIQETGTRAGDHLSWRALGEAPETELETDASATTARRSSSWPRMAPDGQAPERTMA